MITVTSVAAGFPYSISTFVSKVMWNVQGHSVSHQVALLRPRKEAPWMLGTTAMEAFPVSLALSSQSKTIVASIAITIKVPVHTLARLQLEV